jgi:hypothetical protein
MTNQDNTPKQWLVGFMKQGRAAEVGLRNTLEPDPDNTGVETVQLSAHYHS